MCLITPGHLASTPRLVKNADALAAAGFDVHVVASQHFPPAEPLDLEILKNARWSCKRVPFNRGVVGRLRRLARKAAQLRVARGSVSVPLAARAQHAGHAALADAARRTDADLYFGHGGVAGLAVAAEAARAGRRAYAFDAEDWHEEENEIVAGDSVEGRSVRHLLRELLPSAAYVTTAAPLMGEVFAQRYGVSPVYLLNVFQRGEAPSAPITPHAPLEDAPAVLYWFSQTIGPGRGLEQFIDMAGRLTTPVTLHLRGFVDQDYARSLTERASARGLRPPTFLPPGPPADMARLAASAHLGLSLELRSPRNRDLCLTNKIFTYLLGGVPVALTATRAQTALAQELGPAALLLEGDPAAATRRLDAFLSDPAAQRAARAAAWQLGQDRYNWDIESGRLVAAVERVLPSRRPAP